MHKHEADSSKFPFHWGMSTASPFLHALTQDDADLPETSRKKDSVSYFLHILGSTLISSSLS